VEYLPAAQLVKPLLLLLLYLPAVASMQTVAPLLPWYIPSEHDWHVVAPAAENVPDEQTRQESPSWSSVDVPYLPAAHAVHAVMPVVV
jgi:hypothetical protein